MIIHKTFRENIKFDEREKRLLFVDKNPDAESINKKKTENSTKKTKDKKEKVEINEAEKTLRKIETARKNESKKGEIAGEAVQNIREGYLDSVKKLREFIRKKIDDLGVGNFKSENAQERWALQEFVKEIEKRVNSLLNGVDADKIKKEVEAEKVLAQKCWRQMQDIFSDEKKLFLEALRVRDLPAGLADKSKNFDIAKIFELKNKAISSDEILIGTVNEDLFLLEESLNSIKKLYRKWKSAKFENKAKTRWRLDSAEKNFAKLKFGIQENEEFRHLSENWDKFAELKKNNFQQFRKILSDPNSSESDLKLLTAFLDSEDEEFDQLQKKLEEIQKQKFAEKPDKIKNLPNKEEEKERHSDRKIDDERDDLESHRDKKTTTHKLVEKLVNGLTLNKKIRYYSIFDIVESLKLVKDAWKKHGESVSQDKRPALAEGLMFWRQEVARRIHHIDIAEERNRADDLKKTYKNFTDERLLAELDELPTKDRRRAILESLADRGSLRMSNRALIRIVCPGEFEEKDWEEADMKILYSPMREAFKRNIDKKFIGEVNYGKELLQMQNTGFSKAEDAGKQFASSNEAGSTRAEVSMLEKQIYRVPMEGEGNVTGVLTEMINRANTFGNNGDFIKSEIMINGERREINRIADMGLVGLFITEAFTRNKLSRELMMYIGKSHEQCFRPFSVFQEVVGAKKIKDPITGRNISHFEYWGWVNKNGVTNLGETQIINFFNTRNAKAQIETPQGKIEKIVHIATDSCYKIHSGTRVNSIEQVRANNKVGDKFTGYIMKATGIDVYDQATRLRRDTGSATGELREITSMIKAGVEDFADGRQMMDSGKERYFDSLSDKEVNSDGHFIDPTTQEIDEEENRKRGGPIGQERILAMGEIRMERGKEILVRVLRNMWLYREDRKILEVSPLYTFYDRENTDEGVAQESSTKITGTLREFLETSLGQKWKNTPEYQEIMHAVARLEDPDEMFSRSEIDKMRNVGTPENIERKSDLQKPTKN